MDRSNDRWNSIDDSWEFHWDSFGQWKGCFVLSDSPIVPSDSPIVPSDSPIVPSNSPIVPSDSPIVPPNSPFSLSHSLRVLPILPIRKTK